MLCYVRPNYVTARFVPGAERAARGATTTGGRRAKRERQRRELQRVAVLCCVSSCVELFNRLMMTLIVVAHEYFVV